VQKLLDQHDVQTSIVDVNRSIVLLLFLQKQNLATALQILSRGIPAPWNTRRHISNHAHDAAMADAAGPDMEELRDPAKTGELRGGARRPGPRGPQDTCTHANRPQNMPITPHESMAGHWFSYNRLLASRGGVGRTRPIRPTPHALTCPPLSSSPPSEQFYHRSQSCSNKHTHLSRSRLFQRHLRSLGWVWFWVWDWVHTPPHTILSFSPPSFHTISLSLAFTST